jgi:hypothetical protein
MNCPNEYVETVRAIEQGYQQGLLLGAFLMEEGVEGLSDEVLASQLAHRFAHLNARAPYLIEPRDALSACFAHGLREGTRHFEGFIGNPQRDAASLFARLASHVPILETILQDEGAHGVTPAPVHVAAHGPDDKSWCDHCGTAIHEGLYDKMSLQLRFASGDCSLFGDGEGFTLLLCLSCARDLFGSHVTYTFW